MSTQWTEHQRADFIEQNGYDPVPPPGTNEPIRKLNKEQEEALYRATIERCKNELNREVNPGWKDHYQVIIDRLEACIQVLNNEW